MKMAICNEIFQGWPIEAALEYCAKAGYDGIEIAPFTLAKTVNQITPETRRDLREKAARFGLEICGLHWLLARTEGLGLTHPDTATRDRTARYLCDLVDCCADLGGKVLVRVPPSSAMSRQDNPRPKHGIWRPGHCARLCSEPRNAGP